MTTLKKHEAPAKPLDGGWGWVIVAGGIIALFQWGIMIRCFGVFYIEMSEHHEASAAQLSWVGALNMAIGGVFGPFSSALIKRFSHRWVTIAGGFLGCLSMILTAFAPTVEVTYLTYGVLGGLACSLAYTPTFTLVGEYFQKKRASAMGVMSCGTAIAAFAAPPIIRCVYEEFNYRASTVMVGAILLNTCVGGALFRPLANNRPRVEKNDEPCELKEMNAEDTNKTLLIEDNDKIEDVSNGNCKCGSSPGISETSQKLENIDEKENSPLQQSSQNDNISQELSAREQLLVENGKPATDNVAKQNGNVTGLKKETIFIRAWSSFKKYFDPSLLLDINLFALNLVQLSILMVLSITSAFLPAYARDLGYTKMKGAFLLSLSGMGSLMAVPAGFCLDVPVIKRNLMFIYFGLCVVAAFTSLVTPAFTSYSVQCILSFIRGAACNTIQSQRATVSVSLVGVGRLTSAFGYLLLFSAAGSLLGRSTTGIIRDRFGSYDVAFYCSGAVLMMSSMFFLGTNIYRQCRTKKEKRQEEITYKV